MCRRARASIMPLFSWPFSRGRGGVGEEPTGGGGEAAAKKNTGWWTPLPPVSLTSSPSSPSSSLPMSKLWHRIPHMPLIWSEATQEQSYLTAVEFSTLAADASPEAIKQKSGVGCVTGPEKQGRRPPVNESTWQPSLLFVRGRCLPESVSESGRMER